MIDIPVLCDAEHLPRVRLLMSHMQRLGINLELVEVADPQAVCVLLVPRASQSRLAVDAEAETTSIVLYLEQDAELIGGDLDFHIPAWPARSSDEDVRRLARALRTWRKDSAPSPAADKRRFDRNNVIALGVIALTVLGLYALTQTSNADREEDTETVEISSAEPGNSAATAAEDKSPVDAVNPGPGREDGNGTSTELRNGKRELPDPLQAEASEAGQGDATYAAARSTMLAIAAPPPWPTLPLYICPAQSPAPPRNLRGLVCEPLFDESEHLFR